MSKWIQNKREKSFFEKHFSLTIDLWNLMKARKMFWFFPAILMILLVGIIIIFGESSSLSPFIYALF